MPTKLSDILDGWKNLIFHDKTIEQLAHNRAAICSTCEHSKLDICTICYCPLMTKCRSPKSTCPKNKWPE